MQECIYENTTIVSNNKYNYMLYQNNSEKHAMKILAAHNNIVAKEIGSDVKSKERLANNLNRLASRDGYSKSGLARFLNVSANIVSRWCAGSSFPLHYLDDIAKYFDVDVTTLFAAPEDVIPPARSDLETALQVVAKELGYQLHKGREPVDKKSGKKKSK